MKEGLSSCSIKNPDYRSLYYELRKVAKGAVEGTEYYLNANQLVLAVKSLERLRQAIDALDMAEGKIGGKDNE